MLLKYAVSYTSNLADVAALEGNELNVLGGMQVQPRGLRLRNTVTGEQALDGAVTRGRLKSLLVPIVPGCLVVFMFLLSPSQSHAA